MTHGSDEITLRFLKDSLPAVILSNTCIFNTSIVTGTFPRVWKHAIVIPVFKEVDVNDLQNYRPMSLLYAVSKILEVVASQLSRHLEGNHLLSYTQHGFRPRLSTETALMTLSNKLYENIDNKKISLITLCDLSKAFNSVSRKILLSKLTKLGINTLWSENYLCNRT